MSRRSCWQLLTVCAKFKPTAWSDDKLCLITCCRWTGSTVNCYECTPPFNWIIPSEKNRLRHKLSSSTFRLHQTKVLQKKTVSFHLIPGLIPLYLWFGHIDEYYFLGHRYSFRTECMHNNKWCFDWLHAQVYLRLHVTLQRSSAVQSLYRWRKISK